MRRPTAALLALLTATALLAAPGVAAARHGGDRPEVRADGTCSGPARATLKLKADDGAIEAELELEHARGGSAWRVTIAQEGRVVWRATVRAGSGSGAFTLQRRLRDYAGADRVSVRASAASGASCRAAATLPGD